MPAITITVTVDDVPPRAVAWSEGVFAGDADLADRAAAIAAIGASVLVLPPNATATADAATPHGALAAMLGAAVGRGRPVGVDPSVWAAMIGGPTDPDVIY